MSTVFLCFTKVNISHANPLFSAQLEWQCFSLHFISCGWVPWKLNIMLLCLEDSDAIRRATWGNRKITRKHKEDTVCFRGLGVPSFWHFWHSFGGIFFLSIVTRIIIRFSKTLDVKQSLWQWFMGLYYAGLKRRLVPLMLTAKACCCSCMQETNNTFSFLSVQREWGIPQSESSQTPWSESCCIPAFSNNYTISPESWH